MNPAENKKLLQHIFAELAHGNARPLAQNMADDFTWTVTGSTNWSKKYEGKRAVIEQLLNRIRDTLAPPVVIEAQRFIADEECVAVEAKGRNKTSDGVPYNQTYCFVFRLSGGKLQEVTEYMDTELVTSVFGARATSA